MFRFADPWFLSLMWMLPIIIVLYVLVQKRSRAKIKKALGEKLSPFLTSSYSSKKRRIKLVCQLIALAFILVALARPQAGKKQQEAKSQGIELMIALDVSNSMLAEDVRPSRLDFAKKEISGLLDQLTGDKVGLIAFAGSAILMSPLTTDKSALKMFLESLSPDSIETQGTDFQTALSEAAQAFVRGGVDTEADENTSVSRVVLVASDGEDHEEGAYDLAERLSQEGIRVFSLAFGTERGGRIPLKDGRGYLKGYKKDEQNKDVVTKLSGDSLRRLASAGKGSFHHVVYGGGQMKTLRNELAQLEQAEFDSVIATNYDERYQIFLLIGLILALVELLFGERKSSSRIWRGRFEVNSK